MAKKPTTANRIALRTKSGTFETPLSTDELDASGALARCPERGTPLPDGDLVKYARSIWPSLDPRDLPATEAGRRFQLLCDEQERRDAEAE